MTADIAAGTTAILDDKKIFYNRFLLIVAGLGGLLYGVDVGIIAGALPYLEATSGLNAGQLSIVVAAVLLGSVISTLFAGLLADWMGRKIADGLERCHVRHQHPDDRPGARVRPAGLWPFAAGCERGLDRRCRSSLLSGVLDRIESRQRHGIFQWLLTAGIVTAALVGAYFSWRVDQVAQLGDAARLFTYKDTAWRGIFWVSLPPGILFVIGSFMVAESPRWLLRRGRKDAAYTALLRSRTTDRPISSSKKCRSSGRLKKGAHPVQQRLATHC